MILVEPRRMRPRLLQVLHGALARGVFPQSVESGLRVCRVGDADVVLATCGSAAAPSIFCNNAALEPVGSRQGVHGKDVYFR